MNLESFNLKAKIAEKVREKAISQAKTRIILAGKSPEEFSEEQLEVIVLEEEQKIKGSYKEKGLIVLASLLGLSLWN